MKTNWMFDQIGFFQSLALWNIVYCLITAFFLTFLIIPLIIYYSDKLNWQDIPDERKEHAVPIPTMGGLGIFIGAIASVFIWGLNDNSMVFFSVILSCLVLLTIGLLDDRFSLSVKFRFLIQLLIAFGVSLLGIKINSLNGLFGIYELPLMMQYLISMVAIVGIINAFNLIDGIDCLAGGLGMISLWALSGILYYMGDKELAILGMAWSGSLAAFLWFNFQPARIFMGDTGSLTTGFLIAVLSIQIINLNSMPYKDFFIKIPHADILVFGIISIPVLDTLRVFAGRILKSRSPFSPDKSHIHHLLTRTGLSHNTSVFIICLYHIFLLLSLYFIQNINSYAILAFIILLYIGIIKLMLVNHKFSKLMDYEDETVNN